ncbi:hypothetical protein FBQ96_11265 [Nitrospirales bacterium NOB]|nr:Lon protease [Nitrospirota bacterium]MDL1890140.1 hypothetical protein [Nitrospirales bacterium NOB]
MDTVVELPILAAIQSNNQGVFEVLLLRWDHSPTPSPIVLQWQGGNIQLGQANFSSMVQAFRYALEQSEAVELTGTVTATGITYIPINSDGPSAGAVMTIGFAALLKGDQLLRGIALTGTVTGDGDIGPVGGIPDKVRAAAREGYRTILIPSGQRYGPHWNLDRLAMDLNVEIEEVGTIAEAYHLMTGESLR